MASDVAKLLGDLNLELKNIDDPNLRRCVVGLLNMLQQLSSENTSLRETVQKLKDEIARLKGEQGKPDVKPNKDKESKNKDISSEKQRKEPKESKKRKKKIEIDRSEACPVDRETLPDDAVYKGTETTVIQDVVFRRDNVAFEREKFYSPSLNKTFYGPLPPEYEGYRFGPGVRTLVLTLYYATGTSEPKILELLASIDVHMSDCELSNLLIHKVTMFHEEAGEIQQAALESSPWHQIDDTGTRVNGVNHYCHVLCNPLYSIYRTMARKDRPTVLAVLRGTETPRYLVNALAVALAANLGVSGALLGYFQSRLPHDEELDEEAFNAAWNKALCWIDGQPKRKLYEAAAHVMWDVPQVAISGRLCS